MGTLMLPDPWSHHNDVVAHLRGYSHQGWVSSQGVAGWECNASKHLTLLSGHFFYYFYYELLGYISIPVCCYASCQEFPFGTTGLSGCSSRLCIRLSELGSRMLHVIAHDFEWHRLSLVSRHSIPIVLYIWILTTISSRSQRCSVYIWDDVFLLLYV